jgi:hypothetical protein
MGRLAAAFSFSCSRPYLDRPIQREKRIEEEGGSSSSPHTVRHFFDSIFEEES